MDCSTIKSMVLAELIAAAQTTRNAFFRLLNRTDIVQHMKDEAASAPAAGRIAENLRGKVMAGGLSPGTPLRDAALAAQFEVSRNTMREALRTLQHEGLVEHYINRGFVVPVLGPDDVLDIYAARRVIEIRAVQESATCSSAVLAPVGQAVDDGDRAVDDEAWGALGTASLAFHQALVATLGSASLNDFFASVAARLRLAFAVMDNEREFQLPWLSRDRRIWELIQTGRRDEAEKALSDYLDDSERQVLDVVRGSAGKTSADKTGTGKITATGRAGKGPTPASGTSITDRKDVTS
jgi:DNA-binding GntR family transcriptional regulator